MSLTIKRYIWNYTDSNSYLLKENGQVLIVDPIENPIIFNNCKGALTVTVLLTHEHLDHIYGLNTLRAKLRCSVITSKECSSRIENPKTNLSAYAEAMISLTERFPHKYLKPFCCMKADITFQDHYLFSWSGHQVEMFLTPGHSPGSTCILIENMLFAGDTLLENGLMTRFPGSNKYLYKTKTVPMLQRLLNKASVIYPGHGAAMTRDVANKVLTLQQR